MIRLHGRADSSNVQKVLWLFDELGIEYDRIDCGDAFGGLDTPEYLALNPNSRIPTVEDGGQVIWESQAILRHYAQAHPEAGLLPVSPADMSRVEMALDWNHTTFWPALRPPYVRMAVDGAPRDDREVRHGLDACQKVLPALDWLLAGRNYVGGDRFSIGDIPIGVSMHRYLWMGGRLEGWPSIADWQDRIASRPAYRSRLIVKGG